MEKKEPPPEVLERSHSADVFGNRKLINLLHHERVSIKSNYYITHSPEPPGSNEHLARKVISKFNPSNHQRAEKWYENSQNVHANFFKTYPSSAQQNNKAQTKSKWTKFGRRKKHDKNYYFRDTKCQTVATTKKSRPFFYRKNNNQLYYYVRPRLKPAMVNDEKKNERKKTNRSRIRMNPFVDMRRKFFVVPKRSRMRLPPFGGKNDEMKFIETVIEKVATTRRMQKKTNERGSIYWVYSNKKSRSINDLSESADNGNNENGKNECKDVIPGRSLSYETGLKTYK